MDTNTKKFILDIRDRMIALNIVELCMNFMRTHPQMFKDTQTGNKKIMSVDIGVCICCDPDKIDTDPGFITIGIDSENTFSEHFGTGHKYFNNEKEEQDESN